MISANLSAIFYLISGVLFILALRGLSSPETSRQGNFLEFWNGNCCCNIFSMWKFFKLDLFCFIIYFIRGSIGAFIAFKIPMTAMPELLQDFIV